ncbi:MAG: glycerol-3-phosphate dehydrogenase/oxidase [Gemmatimonadaceae bacterium]
MHLRAPALEELSSKTFDALIIGGGITGAGIARDAAMRGLSVALVDKGDFASGTSSRSSRLIHGGVRYLEHGHLHLVFEASAERRRLMRLAPHLVRPLPFTWPVYLGQRLPIWKLAVGLTLYDLLSLFRNVERHRRLSADDVLAAEPSLCSDHLRGGVRYFDAATDDARLTLANVLDAQRHGAVVANHVAFTGVGESSDGLTVSRLEDTLTGNRLEIRAQLRVNATGPWSDAVRQLQGAPPTSKVQGSKGSHVALRRERVGNRDAVTLLHPRDGRVMFTLPAGANTIIGTTDTFTSVSPDEVRASESDVAYLLEAANAFFPDARLNRDDVVAAWAGIRPLMPSKGSSVQASREHAIARDGREVTITGGKLTTFRVMAAEVVDVVQRALRMPQTRAPTDERPLPGGDPAHAGPQVTIGLSYRMGALRWAVDHEMACTLGDLLIRRTRIAFETRDNGRAAARRVATFLGWEPKELERYDAEVARIFTIDP